MKGPKIIINKIIELKLDRFLPWVIGIFILVLYLAAVYFIYIRLITRLRDG